MSYCLLIPHYNHERQFLAFLPQLIATGLPLVVVDDGSNDHSRAQVAAAVAQYANAHFFALQRNRGKGGALKAGFYFARSLGFTHAIQIDADGQHDIQDIAGLHWKRSHCASKMVYVAFVFIRSRKLKMCSTSISSAIVWILIPSC
jgi:glycosyltransferase involved in cell wall biosynthesis